MVRTCARSARASTLGALFVTLLTSCASPRRDLEGEVRAALERRSWPATSVLVVERDTVRLNLGHRTPPARDPQDLVYPLGSISKMFTAAAVHRLAERGDVDLEAPVAQYLPDWPSAWRAVRVHQLLGHTSGIPDFWLVPDAAALLSDPTARAADLARVIARMPLQFEPGSRFSYSNTAYHAAARVIERRTGLSYDAFLARELFAPLGLTSMHHCRGDAGEMPGHVLRDDEAQPIAAENYETARGDGGLCGSARDLARWFQAMATGPLTRGPSWGTYTSPQRLADGTHVPYGHGISLRPLVTHQKLGHHGAMAGHSGMVAWYRDRNLVIVVLASVGGVWADTIEQTVAAALLRVDAPRAIDGEPPSTHVGRFDVGPFVMEIETRGGSLWLESPPPGPRGRLVRVGVESYALDGDPWGVVVHMNCADGQCPGVRLHMAGMEWPGRRVLTSPEATIPGR
jgi:CubicO group peptidase (beta-lactamase class C family)